MYHNRSSPLYSNFLSTLILWHVMGMIACYEIVRHCPLLFDQITNYYTSIDMH